MKDQKISLEIWILIVFLLAVIVGVALAGIYRYNALERKIQASYCVPKGYAGVYYDLNENVAITVLDLNSTGQARITSQLDSIFKGLGQ